MTFLAFRPFRRQKQRNDIIVASDIKISQILKLKLKDITSKTLHANFYASRIKNKRIRRGGKIRPPPWVWSVFKSPGKIGLRNIFFEILPYTKTLLKVSDHVFKKILYESTTLTRNKPDFLESGNWGGWIPLLPPCVTSLFEGQ